PAHVFGRRALRGAARGRLDDGAPRRAHVRRAVSTRTRGWTGVRGLPRRCARRRCAGESAVRGPHTGAATGAEAARRAPSRLRALSADAGGGRSRATPLLVAARALPREEVRHDRGGGGAREGADALQP